MKTLAIVVVGGPAAGINAVMAAATIDDALRHGGPRRPRPLLPGGGRHRRARESFALVLTSPLKRARETCELAGLGDRVQMDPDLLEWNYGEYEGLAPAEIHERAPGWLVFTDGAPDGERPDDEGRRVDRVIARARAAPGNVAVFGHGHLLRVLAARWLAWPVAAGRHFLLDTGTVNVLSAYREAPAIKRWNAPVGR